MGEGDKMAQMILAAPDPIGGDFNELKPAAVISTSRIREGAFGQAIRWLTKVKGEPVTEASHTAMVHHVDYPARSPSDVHIIEQTYPHVRMGTLSDFAGARYWIAQNIMLLEDERLDIIAAAESLPDKHYGLLKLPLFAIDGLIGKGMNWFRYGILEKRFGVCKEPWRMPILSRLDFTKTLVCSQFVAWAYDKGAPALCRVPDACANILVARPAFGGPPITRTPDDIDDWTRSERGHNVGWRVVLSRSG
jgi:hypothetical protein